MIKLFVIITVFAFVSCHEGEEYPASYAVQKPASVQNRVSKSYRKVGNVLNFDTYAEKRNIIMWDTYLGAKDTMYNFVPGEKVMVYARVGDYVFLSPLKDTTLSGYILAGWIEFDHDNKVTNERDMAALPVYHPVSLQQVTSNSMPAAVTPNLTTILKRNGKKLRADSIHFDEKHLLQDELGLPKRADTIKLYY